MLYFARMAREAQLQLLSRYENIELAEQVLAELGRDGDVERETLYWVGMALREALANAIKHGNKLNPDKRVFVEMTVVPHEEVRIAIEDEGEGFDPARLTDPTDTDNLLRASGRGVFYMKSFMDTVEFRTSPRGGTRIELSKRLVARRPA
jgi:serine/threonine-protein kinase RsbW